MIHAEYGIESGVILDDRQMFVFRIYTQMERAKMAHQGGGVNLNVNKIILGIL